MINSFSTEATARVFGKIANNPDLFERAAALVKSSPATAPREIKSWVETQVNLEARLLGGELTKDLLDAAMHDVRWQEIRTAIQRMQ